MSTTSEAVQGLASAFKTGVSEFMGGLSSSAKEFASKSLNSGDLMGILKDPSKGGFLGRAAAFGAAGATAGMATHAATGVLGAPLSAAGMVNNDMSPGGFVSAGMKGAVFGAALGAGGFNAQGEMRSGLQNIFKAAGAGASEKQFNSAINKLGGESAEGLFGQISRNMSKGRHDAIMSSAQKTFKDDAIDSFAGSFVNKLQPNNPSSMHAQQKLANEAFNETASQYGKAAYGENFMNRAASAGKQFFSGKGGMSGAGAAVAAGGFVNSMYSANALGVSIPSNYGYR